MPTAAENDISAKFFLPEFILQFLPDRESIKSLIDNHCFSRDRRLSFEITLSLMLNMVRPGERVGYQKVIDRFFSETGRAFTNGDSVVPPDKGAFCRARKKIPVKVCQILFANASEYALSLAQKNNAFTWKGFQVYAIDATKKNLPASPELLDYFEAPSHAHYPQMITSALYDVLAKIPLNYMRAPFNTPERDMAMVLLEDLMPGALLLLDRGHPGFLMFHKIAKKHIKFLARLPKNGLFKEINQLIKQGKRDFNVTLRPTQKLVNEHPEETFKPLTLRVIVVSLPGSNEPAIFITNLMNRRKYSPLKLRDLYHFRWNEEEFFKTIKEHLRAEEFRGKSVQFIDQELLCTYTYYTLTRILMFEAAKQSDLPVDNLETKAALLAVSRYLDRLLLAETIQQCQELLTYCLTEIAWRKYQPRPGRKFPRKSKSRHGKWANKWS
jgi:hypothetical protein